MSVRRITPVEEQQLTNHDLVGAKEDYGQPFLIVVQEKECRKWYQGHKQKQHDVDPEKDPVIPNNKAELLLMEDPKDS
jgi:hypothetical protein